MSPQDADGKLTVLYLAPWVDLGGSDRNTVDLARWLDRDRFRLIVVTTQESPNRRLAEIARYADEVWPLPELVPGGRMPSLLAHVIEARGVDIVHVMNSRLGFDLLPDIAALPDPPGVLVQLHVEEADRTGYVRYVTTRYGNLVDAWSVSSRTLAGIVEGYGIAPDRLNVIYTGVDGEREFNPELATPVALEPDAFHVLFLGRWVDQKDPLLMLDVATRLTERHPHVRVHAVGEGDLEDAMRARIAAAGLERHVLLHPTTDDVQSWFAACQALLMTSIYEGLPLVLFEAMAMGVPIVAPALPANAELMGDAAGMLIDPRDDVEAYVEALCGLVSDPAQAAAIGVTARARVRDGFGIRAMADGHGAVYAAIAEQRDERRRQRQRDGALQSDAAVELAPVLPPMRFRSRVLGDQPLVSIVIPCFEHGRWLRDVLESIDEQDYPALETIVVDDGSRDSVTLALLDELEAGDRVEVVRMPANGGPSRARNAGLERARGRYILPVDADNVLMPGAVANLVAQISVAGELVGFIYPNMQFFGNRDDYARAPAWNPYRLLQQNYCDTCSLYDRDLFDAGLRYPEDIVFGHEDWDLALTLAASGVRGEPAHKPTVLVRKLGFTRSDLVDHASASFARMRRRHPGLYGQRHLLKARWNPFLSIVALSAVDAASEEGRRLRQRAARQTFTDAELVLPHSGAWWHGGAGPWVRRLPPASSALDEGRIGVGLAMARGRVVLVTTGTGSSLLADPAALEKLALAFETMDVDAIALLPATSSESVPFGVLPDPADDAEPEALAWRSGGPWLPGMVASAGGDELSSLARALVRGGARLHWRSCSPARPEAIAVPPRRCVRPPVPVSEPEPPPPAGGGGHIQRFGWHPPQTRVLVRYRRVGSEERHHSVADTPPPGFALEAVLGALHADSPAGTTKLYATAEGSFLTSTVPAAAAKIGPGDYYFGSLELVGFIGLDGLLLGVMHATGQHVLVAGRDDPLFAHVEIRAELGWLEPVPLRPRSAAGAVSAFGLAGLCRSLDLDARRHRYALGAMPAGVPIGELGSLHLEPQEGSTPLWLTGDGWLATTAELAEDSPDLRQLAHWAAAPAAWRGFGRRGARARSVARRASEARSLLRTAAPVRPAAGSARVGYGHSQPGLGRVPLYAARHRVTGDQLLTRYPLEAQDMGYEGLELLAWINERTPVTGESGFRRIAVPWASRYGLEARWA